MVKQVIFPGQAPSRYELNDVCNISSEELQTYIDTGRYGIEIVGEAKSDTPDDSWSNNDIRKYLDGKGIEYKARDSKAELLEAI